MILLTDGFPMMGNKKNIDFKNYIPTNCEISLSEISFRNYGNNLKTDGFMEFNLTIRGKIHLPSIKIYIQKNYFPDMIHFMNTVEYHLEKKIHFFQEKKYYNHFLTRFTSHNGTFVMLNNDGDLHYEMGLTLNDSVKDFLNMSENTFNISEMGFKNKKLIRFQSEAIFPMKCHELEVTPFLGNNYVREIQSTGGYGVLQHIEFDDLEWRKLQNFSFNRLTLDWPNEYKIVNYVIKVREYF